MKRAMGAGVWIGTLGFIFEGPDGFWPFDGGTLELSGRLGGRPSLASSSAIRAASLAFSAVSASLRAVSASIRAISVAIRASLSIKSGGGGFTHRLTHIRRFAASGSRPTESI